MKRRDIARLAGRKAVNHALQFVDLYTGLELSRPDCIIFDLTHRCVCRCRYCSIWSHQDERPELTARQWRTVIDDFVRWLGPFSLTLSGGDPFIRPDAIDIVEHACEADLLVYVNCTGLLLDDAELERRLLLAGVQRLNLSLDSLEAEVFDRLRGRPGAHRQTLRTIDRLLELRQRIGSRTGIAITLTLTADNLDGVLDVVDYAHRQGLDGVQISALYEDPVGPHDADWHRHDALWVRDSVALKRAVDQLIQRRRAGAPIANPESQLRLMRTYFDHPERLRERRCISPMRAFGVNPYGDTNICYFFSRTLGNVLHQPPDAIWRSAAAARKRAQLRRCDRSCHLVNSTYWKGLDGRVRDLLDVVRRARRT